MTLLPAGQLSAREVAWQAASDGLAVDVGQLRRLLRWAGLGELTVTDHDGQVGAPLVQVTVETPYEKPLPRSTSDKPLANYVRWLATLSLNRVRLAEEVERRVARGAPFEAARAGVVDEAVRRGMLRAAVKTLTNVGGELGPRILPPMGFLLVLVGLVRQPLYAIIFYASMYLIDICLGSVINWAMWGSARLSRRRWSVMFGVVHLDRLAAVAVLAARHRLVTPAGATN